MTRLRWGDTAPEGLDAARTRLIDAAEACFDRYGVLKTRVEDVATEAHVSRATVYRYFSGRDDLVLAVLLRAAGRFLGRLEAKVRGQDDLADALVEGVLFTVESVRMDPHLALLFTPEAAGLTTRIAGASEALFTTTADFLRPLLVGNPQARQGVDVEEASEWLLRIILSLLTAPGPVERTAAAQRRYLHTFLVPALVEPSPQTRLRRRPQKSARRRRA